MIRYLGKLGMLVLLGRFGRFGSFKIQGPSSNSDQTLFESRNGVKSMESTWEAVVWISQSTIGKDMLPQIDVLQP